MEKFNSTSILTGYIKQLLASFNLPKIRVYTKEYADYKFKHGVESPEILRTITTSTDLTEKTIYPENLKYVPYLKDKRIQELVNNTWVDVGRVHGKFNHVHFYNYGEPLLNYTKKLIIKNNIYDSYTHEYLGDYLRFQRDYLGIDLMPLYNCFSNRECPELYINNRTYNFNTADAQYKIYMMPIKLFKKYTIAIDSDFPIEVCCGLYGNMQDASAKSNKIIDLTYQKFNCCQFSQPVLYDKLSYENLNNLGATLSEISFMEKNLKLFIKVPISNTSTIVVLEGNYLNWNDSIFVTYKKSTIAFKGYKLIGNTDFTNINGGNTFTTGDKVIDLKNGNIYRYEEHKQKNTTSKKETTSEFIFESSIWKSTKTTSYINNSNWIKIKNKIHIDSTAAYPNFSDLPTGWLQKNVKEQIKSNDAYFNTSNCTLYLNYFAKDNSIENHTVINLEKVAMEKPLTFPLITTLQLLRMNTHEQHPFADRLIEYLMENAITSREEEIVDNVKRTQKAVEKNNFTNNYKPVSYGFWDENLNRILYEFMNSHSSDYSKNHDILGYVDKDIEQIYYYFDSNKQNSLANTYLDEEGK